MPFDPETVMAAHMVVARRMPIMWCGIVAPTPQTCREMDRMVTEKVAAVAEGFAMVPSALFAAAFAAFRAGGNGAPLPLAAMSGFDAATRTVLSPARKRIRANARRLSTPG